MESLVSLSDKVSNQTDLELTLIEGEFQPAEAADLLTRMYLVKIQYHEGKINSNSSEEDIKFRESKIKQLTRDLNALRDQLHLTNGMVHLSTSVKLK